MPMGSQRVRHDLATEQQQQIIIGLAIKFIRIFVPLTKCIHDLWSYHAHAYTRNGQISCSGKQIVLKLFPSLDLF